MKSAGDLISTGAATLMTAIAIIGLTYRTSKKILIFAWDWLGILIGYSLTIYLLYATM
jgi:cation:H+ antiporter